MASLCQLTHGCLLHSSSSPQSLLALARSAVGLGFAGHRGSWLEARTALNLTAPELGMGWKHTKKQLLSRRKGLQPQENTYWAHGCRDSR